MKGFRAHWVEDTRDPRETVPRVRAVSRVAPHRPRWGHLYIALGTIGVVGTAAHFMVHGEVLLEVVDALFAAVLFAALAAWVRLNRIALTRMDEPDAGPGRPHVRIVRSRGRTPEEAFADDKVVRLTPTDHVILPYDFR